MSISWDRAQERAAEYLKDGEWHDREPLIRAMLPTIEPAVAMRRSESLRLKNYPLVDRNSERSPRMQPRTIAEQRQTGARSIVMEVLYTKPFEQRTVERDGREIKQVRMVRLPRRVDFARRLEGDKESES